MHHPLLYEVNTRCWLNRLSTELGRPVTLAGIPDDTISAWQKLGFTHIWLMGVWSTGPKARRLARNNPGLRSRYDELLPGWSEQDVAGSPYSIAEYRVPHEFGGETGLADFRRRLQQAGLKLILDFVPNHLGIDHSWLHTHPERFVIGNEGQTGTFETTTPTRAVWLAHGRDPYFPPWSDTAQLDYRRQETRTAMIQQLQAVAAQCDGVRCDMAMLLLNEVFRQTWDAFPSDEPRPREEFWGGAIKAVRVQHADFLFLAEAYWGLEGALLDLGFDYAYDKRLADLLLEQEGIEVSRHLSKIGIQRVARSAHFLENHDETRVAARLDLPAHRAAALVTLALPGMRFLHDGQLSGARVHYPVQLGRTSAEPVDEAIAGLYNGLLELFPDTSIGRGEAGILEVEGWADNSTAENIVAVQWRMAQVEFDLVLVNLAAAPSQGRVHLQVAGLEQHNWRLKDLTGGSHFTRGGQRLCSEGLHLELPPHAAQMFHCEPEC